MLAGRNGILRLVKQSCWQTAARVSDGQKCFSMLRNEERMVSDTGLVHALPHGTAHPLRETR